MIAPRVIPGGNSGSFRKASDNSFIVGGSVGSYGQNQREMLIVKFDTLGDVLWSNTYGPTNRNSRANQIIETNDGGYVLIGNTDKYDPQGDYYLIKTDSLGSLQWGKTYGGSGREIGLSLDVNSKNEFLLSGASQSFNSDQSGYYLKVDSLGNIVYDKTYGTQGLDAAANLTKLKNDEFLLWGGLDTLINNTEWQWAEFITKFDASGNIIWRTFLSKKQKHNIWQVREMSDGSIVFIGEAVYQGEIEDAGWIGKLDANGNLLWERFHIYKERDFFSREAIFRGDFQQTEDGGYIVAGILWRQQDTTQASVYTTHLWLVKLDSMGCFNGDCGIAVGVNEVPAPRKNDVEILVYPNPVNDILYIETTSQNHQVQNIHIIDLNGRNIIHNKQSPINTSELSPGIYFYQVEMSGGEVVRGKFVKK